MDNSFNKSSSNSALISFLGLNHLEQSARALAVERACERGFSAELAAVLTEQNSRYNKSTKRDEFLATLEQPNAAAVISGQQAGLFLGPLYTIYKAASVIVTAKALAAETGSNVLPIFWLQNEDHDWDEIRRCFITDSSNELAPLELALPNSNSKQSINYRTLGSEINTLHTQLRDILGTLPQADAFLELLLKHYKADLSPSEALAQVLAELFSEHGLLLFDPREKSAISLSKPIMEIAFRERENIVKQLASQRDKIKEAGLLTQVHIRENSPLFFFHEESPSGERYRLLEEKACFSLHGIDKTISEKQLASLLENSPERFSTSALLRPLVQDSLFPTAAYIAGPSEINYMAQIEPLYELFSLEQPLIIPRASFLCIEARLSELLADIKLSPDDLALPEEKLLEKILTAAPQDEVHLQPDELFSKAERSMESGLSELQSSFSLIDKTLLNSLEKIKAKTFGQLEALKGRYIKALSAKNAVSAKRLAKLQAALAPLGREQERVLSLCYFAAKYGSKEFVERIISEIEPYTGKTKEIVL